MLAIEIDFIPQCNKSKYNLLSKSIYTGPSILFTLMLNMDFAGIKACMEAKHHVDEEPYEVILDNYGCCDGPKAGRLRALNSVSSSRKLLKFNQHHSFLESRL